MAGWRSCLCSAAEGKRNLSPVTRNVRQNKFAAWLGSDSIRFFTCFLLSHVQPLDMHFLCIQHSLRWELMRGLVLTRVDVHSTVAQHRCWLAHISAHWICKSMGALAQQPSCGTLHSRLWILPILCTTFINTLNIYRSSNFCENYSKSCLITQLKNYKNSIFFKQWRLQWGFF